MGCLCVVLEAWVVSGSVENLCEFTYLFLWLLDQHLFFKLTGLHQF